MQMWQAREAIVEIGRRLWQRSYVAANDGNISVRLDQDRVCISPTGVSKGFMSPDMLLVTDLEGRPIQGSGQPSSEIRMHLEIYRLRPDVRAVVHAHPPVATAFSVAGVPLDRCVLPESVVVLGAVPIVPYATPWTEEVPAKLRPHIPSSDAVLLQNHGAVTWAENLEAAYFKMETLEMTATVTRHALALGKLNTLGTRDTDRLMQLREENGVPGRLIPCVTGEQSPTDEIVERVTREVLKTLGRDKD